MQAGRVPLTATHGLRAEAAQGFVPRGEAGRPSGLVRLLRAHIKRFGTTLDGRVFQTREAFCGGRGVARRRPGAGDGEDGEAEGLRLAAPAGEGGSARRGRSRSGRRRGALEPGVALAGRGGGGSVPVAWPALGQEGISSSSPESMRAVTVRSALPAWAMATMTYPDVTCHGHAADAFPPGPARNARLSRSAQRRVTGQSARPKRGRRRRCASASARPPPLPETRAREPGGVRLDRRPRARDRPPAHPARRSGSDRDASALGSRRNCRTRWTLQA